MCSTSPSVCDDSSVTACHLPRPSSGSVATFDVIAAAYYGDGPELGRNGKFAWFENDDGVGGAWGKQVLGDLFWGAGEAALEYAGRMKQPGSYYLLLPNSVAERRKQTS